jgi:hypothetical protein
MKSINLQWYSITITIAAAAAVVVVVVVVVVVEALAVVALPDDCKSKSFCWVQMSHLMWGLWGLLQALNSKIDFSFEQYARKRLTTYFQRKHRNATVSMLPLQAI